MVKQIGVVVHPEEITRSWEKVILNSDINLLGIHPVGGIGSHERVRKLAEKGFPPEEKAILENLISHGVKIEYELHAMSLLLPRDYFTLHPQYFRMNEKGERTPDFNCCASNKDALDIIADSAEKLAKTLPYPSGRYNYWLDDVGDAPCRCDECSKLSSSDQALKIYNAVLKGLKRADSNAKQSYLAYRGSSGIPVHVEPEEGILLEFAPFKRNFHIPLTHPDNAVSAKSASECIKYFGSNGAKVLDYWLDNSLYSGWKKPPKEFILDTDVVLNDIEFYKNLSYEIISTFACYLGKDYEELYGFPDIGGYLEHNTN